MINMPSNTVVLVRLVASMLFLLASVACSHTMNLNCDPHSWHGLGIRDGAKGTPSRVVDTYERSCGRQSMVFDRQAYEAGHKEGNAEYCAGQHGFQLGLSGVETKRVCVAEDAVAFNDGLKAGRKLRKAVLDLSQSDLPTNLDSGWYTIMPSSVPAVGQATCPNRPDDVLAPCAVPIPVMVKQGRVNSSDRRIRRSVNTADLIAKCEEAKSNAEERGFYTSLKCS